MAAEPVTLWYTRCGVPTAFGAAIQAGAYAPGGAAALEGARLLALQDSPDPAVHQSHFTHAQPDSFRHGSAFPAIWAQAAGAETRILGISLMRGAQTLLSRPGSGIRTPADLRGRRLLVPCRPAEPIDYLRANTLRLYGLALASAGLTLAEVELVERVIERPFIADRPTPKRAGEAAPGWVRPRAGKWADSVPALLAGEVDVITSGGSIGAPALLHEELLGFHVVFDADWIADDVERANNSTVLVFAVKEALLRRRPDLVGQILDGALEAEALAAADPATFARYIGREQQVAEEFVLRAHGAEGLAAAVRIGFEPRAVAALEAAVDYLDRLRLTPRRIDVAAWLAPEPLAAARARRASR